MVLKAPKFLFHTAKNGRRRFILFMFASWLHSRIWLGLEMSRLIIMRKTPKTQIQQITQTTAPLPDGHWIPLERQVVCLVEDPVRQRLVIRMLPEFGKN